ncbi:hypothetical protein QBC40DRAFT_341164 [Triangularia verruculosa]|uniref:Uncharacterized protein n=1 Tax=Triangularia verruculosa TaxID=2587418 RepID=A0AAN6XFI6_9PEZI|nr:hypothetical protein QBC40DRAFT_341164 [Triangularia verruculosa]
MTRFKGIAFFILGHFAGVVAGDDGDDFANNLITDLGPILTLFGERVTMQFMRGSMTWVDNILLAMGPLGIITIIVAAIRVGGQPWLKALIGRSRETLGNVEMELMSSTSNEVCELWNGESLVRVMGKGPVREFILLPSSSDAETDVLAKDLASLTNGEGEEPGHGWNPFKSKTKTINIQGGGQGPSMIISDTSDDAPNISLNVYCSRRDSELLSMAVLGTVLQLGVLMFAGLAAYHSSELFLKDDAPIGSYAFPCTAIGTVVLVAGLFLCSHVVESRTVEQRYLLGSRGCTAVVVWIQKAATVNDQTFGSYALQPANQQELWSSRLDREDGSAGLRNAKTVLGTSLGLSGFVVQFIGLRGMHWSATIAQLGATMIMTAIRAWVRREPPNSTESLGTPLDPGFELDWLALEFARRSVSASSPPSRFLEHQVWIGRFATANPRDQDVDPQAVAGGKNTTSVWKAQQILKVRTCLADLAGWNGVAFVEAAMLEEAILITLDSLLPAVKGERFTWRLKTDNDDTIELEAIVRDGKWVVNLANSLDAALSLWLHSVKDRELGPGASVNRRNRAMDSRIHNVDSSSEPSLILLGKDSAELRHGLDCWVPGGLTRSSYIRVRRTGPEPDSIQTAPNVGNHFAFEGRVPAHRVVGCGFGCSDGDRYERVESPVETEPVLLAMESRLPLKLLYAHDLFSIFMWALTKDTRMRRLSGCQALNADTSFPLRIGHEKNVLFTTPVVSKLIRDLQGVGLFNLEQAHLVLIPPLSITRKLSQCDSLALEVWGEAMQAHQNGRYDDAAGMLLWLLEIAKLFPPTTRITVQAAGYRGLFRYTRKGRPFRVPWPPSHSWEELRPCRRLINCPGPLEGAYTTVRKLYHQQGRAHPEASAEEMTTEEREACQYYRLHEAVGSRSYKRLSKEEMSLLKKADILGWTPLHYMATSISSDTSHRWRQAAFDIIHRGPSHVQEGSQRAVNARDVKGWTPLHYASRNPHAIDLLTEFLDYRGHLIEGYDGSTPLHCAATAGLEENIRILASKDSDLAFKDRVGFMPLHKAMLGGHVEATRVLWELMSSRERELGSSVQERNYFHFAAWSGKKEILELLYRDWKVKGINTKDNNGIAPAHLAVARGNKDFVKKLVDLKMETKCEPGDGREEIDLNVGSLSTLKWQPDRARLRGDFDCGDVAAHSASRNIANGRWLVNQCSGPSCQKCPSRPKACHLGT